MELGITAFTVATEKEELRIGTSYSDRLGGCLGVVIMTTLLQD